MTRAIEPAAPPARPRGRRPGGAVYKRIAEQIERDIAEGKFPVGSLLPTEAEFGQMLDVGRHTVRDALRVLSQWPILAGLTCYVVSVGVWIIGLSRVDVSLAYPMLSIGYVVNAVAAWWLFGENVSLMRITGMLVIITGVWLVARS